MFVVNHNFDKTQGIHQPTDFSVSDFKKFLGHIFDEPAILKQFSEEKICQALAHLKNFSAPSSSYEQFRDTVLNSLVPNSIYDKSFSDQDLKAFRQQVQAFYQYIEHFEKHSTRLPFSEFTHEALLAMLACDGLTKSKKDIAKMYVTKLLEAPVERFETLRNWYINPKNLELILTHTSLKPEKVMRLMELAHPSALINDTEFRALLIPKHISHEDYVQVIQKLFSTEYSDRLIKASITTVDRQDSMAIPFAHYCLDNEKLVQKMRDLLRPDQKLLDYEKQRIEDFSIYFEAGLKDAEASIAFKQYVEKKIGKDHSLMDPLNFGKGTSLPYYSPKMYLNSALMKNFDAYLEVCKEDPHVLLGVLDLENTLKFESKFKDAEAIKEQLKNQLVLTPEFTFSKEYVNGYDNKQGMQKLEKLFKDDKNPVIEAAITKICLNFTDRFSIKV